MRDSFFMYRIFRNFATKFWVKAKSYVVIHHQIYHRVALSH